MMRCMNPAPSEIVFTKGNRLVNQRHSNSRAMERKTTGSCSSRRAFLRRPEKLFLSSAQMFPDSLGFFWPWPYQYTRKRESRR